MFLFGSPCLYPSSGTNFRIPRFQPAQTITMRKTFVVFLFAASALASPQPQQTATVESSGSSVANSEGDAAASAAASELAEIPSSILTVMETAIPASWQQEILTDPSFRSSVVSAAAAGTYPAWFNELPNSVKSWASANFDGQVVGVTTTTQDVASETASTASMTATSGAPSVTNSAQTTSSGSSSVASSSSGSASASSASPAKSTGGAPAPSGGVTLGIAGAAGALVLALAL